jgi:hypothetical protein
MPYTGRKREEVLARIVEITDSSNIDSIEYDVETEHMVVTFSSNEMYSYRNVPPAVFGALVAADSVGAHFNRLKHKYPGKRI